MSANEQIVLAAALPAMTSHQQQQEEEPIEKANKHRLGFIATCLLRITRANESQDR